jgi:hypothetical protein
MVERVIRNDEVGGSIPSCGTNKINGLDALSVISGENFRKFDRFSKNRIASAQEAGAAAVGPAGNQSRGS